MLKNRDMSGVGLSDLPRNSHISKVNGERQGKRRRILVAKTAEHTVTTVLFTFKAILRNS